jgi:hypothetical protein
MEVGLEISCVGLSAEVLGLLQQGNRLATGTSILRAVCAEFGISTAVWKAGRIHSMLAVYK